MVVNTKNANVAESLMKKLAKHGKPGALIPITNEEMLLLRSNTMHLEVPEDNALADYCAEIRNVRDKLYNTRNFRDTCGHNEVDLRAQADTDIAKAEKELNELINNL